LRIEQTDAVADPRPLNRRAAVRAVREIRGLVQGPPAAAVLGVRAPVAAGGDAVPQVPDHPQAA